MIETNLKSALKNADTVKSPIGDIACYSLNFAELAGEVNIFMENNKIKFTWREYIQLAQIIWDKIKETSRECAGKEIEVKLPPKLSLVAACFSLIGFKL
ncbi:MAG: hypothetical protein RL656_1347 [Bacteroidota bacterium]|jgi:hypothetical protein